MKILLLWDYYDSYLRNFYDVHPIVVGKSYRDQLQLLLDDFFGWPPYLIPELRNLGHEVEIIVGNALPLQMTWARENGVSIAIQDWPLVVVKEQIRRYRPDVLFIGGADQYLGGFLRQIREYCRFVVAWKAVAVSANFDWSNVDLVLSSHTVFIEKFRALGLPSELLLPCFDQRILKNLEDCTPNIELCFVGSLSTVQFRRRMELLSYMQRRIPIQIYSEKMSWRRRPWPIGVFIKQLHLLPFLLRTRPNPAVFGIEMFSVLNRSKIALNAHVESAQGLAGNIRMFEATGVGALLLTENANNLAAIFHPDTEVVTYNSPAEAVEKAKYYLTHELERVSVAKAGQARTLREHNSRERALELDQILRRLAIGYIHQPS